MNTKTTTGILGNGKIIKFPLIFFNHWKWRLTCKSIFFFFLSRETQNTRVSSFRGKWEKRIASLLDCHDILWWRQLWNCKQTWWWLRDHPNYKNQYVKVCVCCLISFNFSKEPLKLMMPLIPCWCFYPKRTNSIMYVLQFSKGWDFVTHLDSHAIFIKFYMHAYCHI